MNARASRADGARPLVGLTGGHEATGRIELQAAARDSLGRIATVRCTNVHEARVAARNMLRARPDIVLLRVVQDGDVRGAVDLLKEARSA